MPRGSKNPWPSRRRTALVAADRLVDNQKSFPIDLGDVATLCWVRRIQFKQLLTDGGIAVRNGGFYVYVRCDPGEDDDFSARFEEDGTGSTLPDRVRYRARFTIAHELAHTLFYDRRLIPPQLRFKLDDDAATKLELACNEIAGTLLLPESLLQQKISTPRNVQPRDLRKLAEEALVSPQTLVRRFAQMRTFSHPEAILASVAYVEGLWVVNAISIHYSLRQIFNKAKSGVAISKLIQNPDFVLLGGEMADVDVDYVGHGGAPMTINFTCELHTNKPRRGSFFLTGTPSRTD